MQQLSEEQRKEWEEKIKNMSPEELQQLQRQQCIFCQIISGKVPSKKIYEDKLCIAVLDINPAAKGHLLLLPKEHYSILPQVPEKILDHLTLVSKSLSQILLKVLHSDGTTIFIANGAAAGQRAQHFLIHVFPRKTGDGILSIEEKLLPQEMVIKVRTAIETKLLKFLGLKKAAKSEPKNIVGMNAEVVDQEIRLEAQPAEKELFITSVAAKRYHKEKCPFAQNIPAANKLIFSPEEAEKSGRKPCTCVSGKRIPLLKPSGEKKEQKKDQLSKNKPKKEKAVLPSPGAVTHKRQDEDVSLDDIAKLFS